VQAAFLAGIEPLERRSPPWRSITMVRLIRLCILSLAVVFGGSSQSGVRADGLIYRLPQDGSWVRYDLSMEGTQDLKWPVKSVGTLMLSSVGRQRIEGQPCRWIELRLDVGAEVKLPDRQVKAQQRHIILKMLIPEEYLTAGADPLAHVRRLYYKDGDRKPELIEDEKWKQYEIDRFRPLFPKPPAGKIADDHRAFEALDTKIGRLDCEKLTFESSYDGPLARGARGRWIWQGEHQVWLSEEVPFGVAGLMLKSQSKEWNGEDGPIPDATSETTKRLTISEVGRGKKSDLPDLE
jgi:hypothetical protein